MKRLFVIMAAVACATLTRAQEPSAAGLKAFDHLDMSLTTGSTGVGIDLASPIGDRFQVRAGFSFMPHFHQTMHFGVQVGDDPEKSHSRFERLSEMLEGFTGYKVDDRIDMLAVPTYYNFNLLLDFYPLPRNKHWRVTAGFYVGNKQIGKSFNTTEDMASLLAVGIYNNMYNQIVNNGTISMGNVGLEIPAEASDRIKNYGTMAIHLGEYSHDILWDDDDFEVVEEGYWEQVGDEWIHHDEGEIVYNHHKGDVRHAKGDPYRMVPDDDSMARAWAFVNRFKPYVGLGYEGRLVKGDDRWHVGFDAGAMFWGGSPRVVTHDGTDLVNDVENIKGKVGDYVDAMSKFKVFPVANLRITCRLF